MTDQSPISGFIAELEQQVLATLMFGGDFRRVTSILAETHFVLDVHKLVFRAIATAHEQYGSTTLPVVAKLLPPDAAQGFMAQTGKAPVTYLASLSSMMVHGPGTIEKQAKAVVSQWARLSISEQALRVHAAANDPAVDPMRIIHGLSADLESVASQLRSGPRRGTMGTLHDASEAAFASAEEARQKGTGVSGITWGLSDLNRVTGGIHAGEVVLVGARPSMGKTAFAGSVARKVAKAGIGTGFISLEMGAVSLANRAITDVAYDWGVKVAYSDFRRGKVSESDIAALRSATQEIESLPLWIEEQSGLSMADIRVKSERMMEAAEKRGAPLKVLMIDYLGLIKPADRYSGNKVSEVTQISGDLKQFAREYDIGLVVLSQLSRQVESREDKRPQLSDLRDSGALEQDADTIMFLFREAYYLDREKASSADGEADRIERLVAVQNKLEAIIAKQRNGAVCTVDLSIDVACSAVRNGEKTYGY